MVTDRLVDAGLVYEGARAFATPRRLALFVQGVPARQPDLKEERKGPRVGAPEGAIAGFLKAAGLASIGEATIQKDPKKGDFYVALTEKPGPARDRRDRRVPAGRAAHLPVAEVDALGRAVGASPAASNGCARCTRSSRPSGPRPRSPRSCMSQVAGITSGNTTYGHRFLAPGAIKVRHFDDYVAKLEKAKVVLDPARRKEIILDDAKNLAFAQGFELVEDEGLLNEVAGPGRMAGRADGHVRRGVPEDSRRGDPRHHPQQPEMLRAARSEDRPARQPLHPHRQHRSHRRRQGDHRRQRARDPRAAVGCEVLLRDRPEDHGSKTGCRSSRTSSSTRSSAPRPSASSALRRLAAELAPLVGADVEKAKRAALLAQGRSAHRSGRRIPRAAGPDGEILRAGAGRGSERSPPRSRSTTSRPGRTIACRPIRSRSRSRSPTRSTRWSASGRSTRSRREARTRMRCAGRRWA